MKSSEKGDRNQKIGESKGEKRGEANPIQTDKIGFPHTGYPILRLLSLAI